MTTRKPATKAKGTPTPAGYKNGSISLAVAPGSTDEDFAAAVARKLTRPEVSAAAVIENWQKDKHDVNALVAELAQQIDIVNGGDLARAEGMLITQAHALDIIFSNLARRATIQEYLGHWETYMRMAMKAQNQCRMTLETLATIKNPPVVFAKQANINTGGQQQVNNGVGPSRAGKSQTAPIEQSGAGHELLADAGTSQSTGGKSSDLAAVGEVHRPAHR